MEGAFLEKGEAKSFVSPLFENTTVRTYADQTEWKAIINIKGTVPAQLQGQLSYFYGKNEEYYADLPLSFDVKLEGGVESTARIKISSIDINPVSYTHLRAHETPEHLVCRLLLE